MKRDHMTAFLGGMLGAVAMMAGAKASGSTIMNDLQRLAGTMAADPGTRASRRLGTALQLINGGLLAQLYLLTFNKVLGRAGWKAGLNLGVAHGLLAGFALAAVPTVHPRVPEQVPAPGAFMSNKGAAHAVALVGVHALFGAVVGAVIASRRDTLTLD